MVTLDFEIQVRCSECEEPLEACFSSAREVVIVEFCKTCKESIAEKAIDEYIEKTN